MSLQYNDTVTEVKVTLCMKVTQPNVSKCLLGIFHNASCFGADIQSSQLQTARIKGLYSAIHTYMHTILPRCLVSFCMAQYREKLQKTLELLIYFAERFEISIKCVC